MRRVCPLCEAESPANVLPVAPGPWILRECRATGMVFVENPPEYESFKEEFAWEASFRRESDARRAAEPLRYSVSQAFKRFRGQILKRSKVTDLTVDLLRDNTSTQIRVIDVGCGSGQLLGDVIGRLPQPQRQRCVPIGIEISTKLAKASGEALARHGGICIHAPAVEGLAQMEPGSADAVVMSSFLEHEIHPLALLRESVRCLKAGGHVVVKVPNYASWNRYLRGPRWCGYRWPDHVNYFTPGTLAAMADRAGFEVRRMQWNDRFPLSDSLYAVLRRQ